ncbi:MAG: MATE family efflux transporter [Candidatus Hydrogenedentes bacterium]|nr:MATE family efflux transporter [Candidatus Hydrogenedentota bacterium]
MKAFDDDLVSGSILRSVWKLSWPIVTMNIINGLRGLVDQVLVGHYVQDVAANAAIGVSWVIFLVVVVSLASLFHGMGVLISQSAGKKAREEMSRVMHDVFLATLYLVIFVIAPIGYLLSPVVLAHVNAKPDVQLYAIPYLRTLFACGLPLSAVFLLSTAMQSSGEAKIPLMLSILTTAVNILLSSVFITGLGIFKPMGTTGAALGTCFAPIPAIIITITLILRRKMILQPPPKWTLIPDFSVLKVVARIGVPSGIHAVALNIGGIFVYRYIGSLEFSSAAQAAYTICYAQLFSFLTWAALGLRGASSSLMGQNIGAGKPARGKRGVHIATAMGLVWAVVWGIVAVTVPQALLGIFNAKDEHVMLYGVTLLRFLAVSGLFLATALALTGGLIGAGETKKPMWIAIVTQIVILLTICQVFKSLGLLSTNVIWAAILVSHVSRFVLTFYAFEHTKWRTTPLELNPAKSG